MFWNDRDVRGLFDPVFLQFRHGILRLLHDLMGYLLSYHGTRQAKILRTPSYMDRSGP